MPRNHHPALAQSTKRRAASPDELREWSIAVQFAFIEALPLVTGWDGREMAFHGGTSLAMSWGSPRFSEDLDFLLREEHLKHPEQLTDLLERVLARMRESLALSHPGLFVELREKNRAKSKLVTFELVASNPTVLQHAMVKTEFWPVNDAYLATVEHEMVFPARRGELVTRSISEVPAVTMRAAVGDKLTALATRPFLKWRDLFDLNLLVGQSHESAAERAQRFLAHIQAYTPTQGLSPRDALALWVRTHGREPGRTQTIEQAQRDLKPWLPPVMWNTLWPAGVARIVDTCTAVVSEVIEALDAMGAFPDEPDMVDDVTGDMGGSDEQVPSEAPLDVDDARRTRTRAPRG